MMASSVEEDCPICKGAIQNPSEPTRCCRKVFCESCLRTAIQTRPKCPYCREPMHRLRARGISLQGLGDPAGLRTTRAVSSNIHVILNHLRDAQAQMPQASGINQPSLVVPTPVMVAQRRPVPRPRSQQPSAHPTPPTLNWSPQQASPSPLSFTELQRFGNIIRTFNCPYCQQGGLDDLKLRDHCNAHHLYDNRQVVCPVCVSLPHGDAQYCSRNFIGHLNLRHCYYIDDITDIHQSDDINMQHAIWLSFIQK